MPKVRKTDKAARTRTRGAPPAREKIATAAKQLFASRGFEGVSIQEVAEKAGVKKALVFYHFTNKEQLFETILRQFYTDHFHVLATAAAEPGEPKERLRRIVSAYLAFIDENWLFPLIVQADIARRSKHLPFIRENFAPLFGAIDAAVREALPRSTGPLAPKHFFLTLSSIVVNYFSYAPVLEPIWGTDPMSPTARAERRQHVMWVLDAMIAQAEATGAAPRRQKA